MKILHTADLHLGKILFGRTAIEDQEYFAREIFLPACRRERPDCVIIAGDVFDRAVAPIPALNLFDEIMTAVAGENIPLVVISGNHDGADRMVLGARLMEPSGVYIRTSLHDVRKPVVIGDLAIHTLPYFDPPQGKAFLGREDAMPYDEIFAAVIDSIDVSDRSLTHILAAHCTVLGSTRCEAESGVSNIIQIGGSDQVPPEIFDKFDYALLGHLHQNQPRGDKAAYAGSPIKYSFDPNERDKALNLLEIGKGSVDLHKIPIAPLRDMIVIRGKFDDLMSGEGSGDYYFAELTDRELIYEPMARLRTVYPNILSMRYADPSFARRLRGEGPDGGDRGELRDKLRVRALGDAEVFSAFLRQMCAADPTDAQLELFLSLCGGEGEI
ncbi:MAG: exonuclease SbcCD subunit D [Oscillospiraceae bacterium]|nr:exonuclease SbcCD subunit D [Oscillospiraceae bacterium]